MEDDSDSNILNRMFNTVNGGVKWSTQQIKSACPWRRKKSENQLTEKETDIKADYRTYPKTDDRTDTRIDDRTDTRTDDRTDTRTDDRTDTRTDDRTDTQIDDRTDTRIDVRTDVEDRQKSEYSDQNLWEYKAPSEMCPPREPPCCFIKMQDPCVPCCCEPKPAPCPPYHEEPREPTCGCDLCKKGYPNDKCCDHREQFRRATFPPRHFEKA